MSINALAAYIERELSAYNVPYYDCVGLAANILRRLEREKDANL